MSDSTSVPKSLKAQITRTSLVLAAAALLREQGPSAVTYRGVAKWAGAASSSVGYYFDSTSQLLYEAGRYNISLWTERAENAAAAAEALAAEECSKQIVSFLLQACLPERGTTPPGHYAQLIAASESSAVTQAYQKGRVALDAAIGRILTHAGIAMPTYMVSTIVDGAAVIGFSEGYDVYELSAQRLQEAIDVYVKASSTQNLFY